MNLNNFQARNKPIEPPKKPEKAPFFLPSIPSLSGEISFKPSESTNDEDAENDREENKRRSDLPPSQFQQLLQSSAEVGNCERPISSHIKSIFNSLSSISMKYSSVLHLFSLCCSFIIYRLY